MTHLKAALAELINRRRSIRDQSRQLKEIARLPIEADALRCVTRTELSDRLDCAQTHGEWSQRETDLLAGCPIEDLITDGVNPGDRRALWYLVKSFGARSVLEVGTNVGASTFHLAAALKSSAGNDDAHLVTVDIEDVNHEETGVWKSRGLLSSPEEMIRKIGARKLVTFVHDTSLRYLEDCSETFDLVFLDGDHTAANVYQEISLCLKLLNRDGIILLHDYFPRNRPLWKGNFPRVGPYLALSRVRKENPRITVLPFNELPWPTKLGTKKTTLALVTRR